MPRATIPELLACGPFTTAQARSAGLSKRQLQGAAWRQVFRGVHVAASMPDTPGLRVEAAALALPAAAALSRHSAALVHGIDLLHRHDEPVTAVVPIGMRTRSRPGVIVTACKLPEEDVERRRGLRVTSAVRTAFDLARAADPSNAWWA